MTKKLIRFQSNISLQAERARAGLTQQELANKAKVHVQTVRYWEGQKNREDLGGMYSVAINKIADALNTPLYAYDYAYGPDERMSKEMAEAFGLGFLFHKPSRKFPNNCGAMQGQCRKRAIQGSQRCKQHGGLSTGAKTKAGLERIRQGQLRRWNSVV